MTNFNKILVPFDNDTRSIRALEYAAMFASGIGAKIVAYHLADPKDYHSKLEFEKKLAKFIDRQLRPKLSKIQLTYPNIQKIELQTQGLEKPLPRHIVDFAIQNEIDFIIMRSHGLPDTDAWESHFKNTNAYKVILEAPCPVFTFMQMPTNLKIKNILLPLDLSEGTLYKIPLAVILAQQFRATLHLISGSEHNDDHEALNKQMDKTQADLKDKGVNVTRNSIYTGTLHAAIAFFITKIDIDLVIIMSRPGFRWSDLWVSPKAKRIISHSKVPVLSIRSDRPFATAI